MDPAMYIANFYRKRNLLPEDTVACMEYTLKCIFNEISKVMIYTGLFWICGLLYEFWACYIVFVSVRIFAGGIHCKTYWGCFFVSFLFISLCVILPQVLSLSTPMLIWATLFSCAFPLLLSPVTPAFRIIKSKSHRTWLRLLALGICLSWVLFAQVANCNEKLMQTILLTVSVANYQLVLPKGVYYFKNRR